MEAQYFEKEARTENPIIKILMVAGIVFLLVATIYIFIAMQNTATATKYLGVTSGKNTIVVSETGTSTTEPKYVALVKFTVMTEATTLDTALTNNQQKVDLIKAFFKNQYINDADMRRIDFNVYPQYEWQTKGVDLTVYPLGKRVITGYQAVESLEVKMIDQTQIGNNIQTAIVRGASQVSGLTFIISNEEDLKKEAKERAITAAQTKATEIAKNLKVGLGKVVGYTESYSSPVYNSTGTATSGSGSNMQIVVGENKIQVTTNISYEIK